MHQFLHILRACLISVTSFGKEVKIMRLKHIAFLSLVFAGLTGCSMANKLVYRIDINQGNYIEQNAVTKLKFGMTKEQVNFLLGPPMLIEAGYPNTWYYVQWLKPGHGDAKKKELTVNFNDDERLIGISGDFQPGETFFEVLQ